MVFKKWASFFTPIELPVLPRNFTAWHVNSLKKIPAIDTCVVNNSWRRPKWQSVEVHATISSATSPGDKSYFFFALKIETKWGTTTAIFYFDEIPLFLFHLKFEFTFLLHFSHIFFLLNIDLQMSLKLLRHFEVIYSFIYHI